ncbi:hypothetical protein EXIGLDRAFT_214124 [Exidia glandulosa HHB12029]|uniref:Uncharacterized protein n=1 Tax=Exidia glandulosa HHB12029 TaxID=1314781 RepID=A0A165MS36_EXIGL|nr:hypothetical protein EXIGLDRAFT_214124 [Exidia glandulosa HHB12029]
MECACIRALALCPRLSLRTPARSAHTRSRSNAHTSRTLRLPMCFVSILGSEIASSQSATHAHIRRRALHRVTSHSGTDKSAQDWRITPSSWHVMDYCYTGDAQHPTWNAPAFEHMSSLARSDTLTDVRALHGRLAQARPSLLPSRQFINYCISSARPG